MLASRNERYVWARRDYQPDPPLFRELARRWRPLARRDEASAYRAASLPVHRPRADDKAAVSRNILFTKSKGWSPWLWVR
jgi:hypothetical protein